MPEGHGDAGHFVSRAVALEPGGPPLKIPVDMKEWPKLAFSPQPILTEDQPVALANSNAPPTKAIKAKLVLQILEVHAGSTQAPFESVPAGTLVRVP